MTRKSHREIERMLRSIEGTSGDHEPPKTVLVIGGDESRAGWQTPEEFQERYDSEERDRMVTLEP